MRSPLRDMLGPRHIVGLQVGATSIRAVQLRNAMGGPEVEHSVQASVSDPERIGETVK